MKSLFNTSRNIRHGIYDGKIETTIEMILIASEKTMQFAGDAVINTASLSTHRFEMTIESARKIQSSLNEWIEEAKKQHAELTIKKE